MSEKFPHLRHILVFGEYFKDFKKTLPQVVLNKIYYVFMLIMTTEVIPAKFFKAIQETDGLFEIRVEEGGNIYRIFCCFDEGNLVILFNGFQKKTQNTPKTEIDKALSIMNDYFSKKGENNK